MNAVLRLLKHELTLIVREPRFWISAFLPPILLVIFFLVARKQAMVTGGEGMSSVPPYVIFTLIAMGAVGIAADIFAGEKERKSLETLMLLPVATKSILLAKFLTILVIPLILSTMATVFLVLTSSGTAFSMANMWWHAWLISLTVAANSMLVSVYAKRVRTAAQMALFINLPLIIALQLLSFVPELGKYLEMVLSILPYYNVLILGLAIRRFSRHFL